MKKRNCCLYIQKTGNKLGKVLKIKSLVERDTKFILKLKKIAFYSRNSNSKNSKLSILWWYVFKKESNFLSSILCWDKLNTLFGL